MTCVSLRVKVNIEGEEEEKELNEDEEGDDGIEDELKGGFIEEARGSMEIEGGGDSNAVQNSQVRRLKLNLNAPNVSKRLRGWISSPSPNP